jgi:hypothetical protein
VVRAAQRLQVVAAVGSTSAPRADVVDVRSQIVASELGHADRVLEQERLPRALPHRAVATLGCATAASLERPPMLTAASAVLHQVRTWLVDTRTGGRVWHHDLLTSNDNRLVDGRIPKQSVTAIP